MKKESYIIAFWSPHGILPFHFCLDYFNDNLKKYGDIQCLDCSSRPFGQRLLQLLRQADLVVVVMRQNELLMDSYFCRDWQLFRNTVYMIPDYFPSDALNETQIQRRYRIPTERLALIPYNARYEEAVRKRKGHCYLRAGQRAGQIYEKCTSFWKSLDRCTYLFAKALENQGQKEEV